MLDAAEALHPGTACHLGAVGHLGGELEGSLTGEWDKVAALTLRRAADWVLASPAELSGSQQPRDHPLARAISASSLLYGATGFTLLGVSPAEAQTALHAACDLAAWLAGFPAQAPSMLIVKHPPPHGEAMANSLGGMLLAVGHLGRQQTLPLDAAARALNVLLLALRRMLRAPAGAAGWMRIMYDLMDTMTDQLARRAPPKTTASFQQALVGLCCQAAAALEALEPGRELAALAACLPCFLAALPHTLGICTGTIMHVPRGGRIKQAERARSYDAVSAEVAVLLRIYHRTATLLQTGPSSFLAGSCAALQSHLHDDQNTRSQQRDIRSRSRLAAACAVNALGCCTWWLPLHATSIGLRTAAAAAIEQFAAPGSVAAALTDFLRSPTVAMIDVMQDNEFSGRTACKLRIHPAADHAADELGRLAVEAMMLMAADVHISDAAIAATAEGAVAACSFLLHETGWTGHEMTFNKHPPGLDIRHWTWPINGLVGLVLRSSPRQMDVTAGNGALGGLMNALRAVCKLKPSSRADVTKLAGMLCLGLSALAEKHPPSRSRMADTSGRHSWATMLATLQEVLPAKSLDRLALTLELVSQAVGQRVCKAATAATSICTSSCSRRCTITCRDSGRC